MNASKAFLSICVLVTLLRGRADAVNIETVPVGNQGNSGEWSGESYGGYGPDRICGAVSYTYNIGRYEVTAGQYTEFLNAVAKTDTYSLYDTVMWTYGYGCKILRSGSSGRYTYSVAQDWANRPVNFVSFWDACRFANWLHNGQPTGDQGAGTTETGAYTLDGYNDWDGRSIQRNGNWKWAVTSEDEWYKAAYYKGGSTNAGYWDYPTSSDILPSNDLIDPDPGNNANFYQSGYTLGSPYWRTEAGEFENSDSPYGTFDQGGNVWEWNESVVREEWDYALRGLRGGAFDLSDTISLPASCRSNDFPSYGERNVGFRVVQVPEPVTLSLLALGGLAMLRRRRR